MLKTCSTADCDVDGYELLPLLNITVMHKEATTPDRHVSRIYSIFTAVFISSPV